MTRLKLRLELVAHHLICEQIVALPGEKPAHRDLIILIGLDSELTTMMTIRNQCLVKLLNRERQSEILRMAVPDVAHEAMKYSI